MLMWAWGYPLDLAWVTKGRGLAMGAAHAGEQSQATQSFLKPDVGSQLFKGTLLYCWMPGILLGLGTLQQTKL